MTRTRLLLRLAVRNVRRNLRRSLLVGSATAIGLALLVMMRAFGDGVHENWIDQGVRLGSGHIALQGKGYHASGALSDRMRATDVSRVQQALARPDIAADVTVAATHLEVMGLASSAGSAVPVLVVGVEPSREASFSPLDDKPVKGRYLNEQDRLGAYIGVDLASRLGIDLGSRFVLTAADSSGQVVGQLVRAVGEFKSGVPEMDGGVVQIPIATARKWLALPGAATTVAVLLQDTRALPAVTRELKASLRGASVSVLPWQLAMPDMDSAVRVDDYGAYLFDVILLAIVALAILNAVLMSVLNRKREFGVLEALGLTPRETGTVVFLEGMLLTFLAGVLGIILGLGVTWLFWRNGLDLTGLWGTDITISGAVINPVLIPKFRLMQVVTSLLWVLLTGLLASLYPAQQASRIDVAAAMKGE